MTKKTKTTKVATVDVESTDGAVVSTDLKFKRPLGQSIKLALHRFFITKYCKAVTFGRFSRAVSAALDIGMERGMYECNQALQAADPKLYKKLIIAAIKKEKERLASINESPKPTKSKSKK